MSASGFVLTSTAIVMQVLAERHDIASARGQRMVSILLFEDLLIVPLLAIVTFLAPTDPTRVAEESSVFIKLITAAGAFAVLVAVGLWLLNPLFRILAKTKIRELMTAAALFVVLGSALLMEMGGLSMAMGAFVAGVLLSESSFRHQLEVDIEPFRGLLLGLFFLGVGMALDLRVVAENWKIILSGVFSLMLMKAVVIYCVARLAKSSHADAIDRAVLMAQGGEFAFVLLSAAATQGVIDAKVHANMTAIVVLSMVFTPLFLIVQQKLRRSGGQAHQDIEHLEHQEQPLHGNVLIIGFGRVGQIASQAPLVYGASLSIIDNDPDIIRQAGKYGFKVYYGDGAREDILHTAGAHNADCMMVCVNDPQAATRIVENVKHHCSGTKVFVRAYDREHALALVKAHADYLIRETFESSIMLGNEVIKSLGADDIQIEEICQNIRRADQERFALEMAGDDFGGKALLFTNVAPKVTDK